MMSLDPQDWNEMIKLLKDTEESLSSISPGDGRQALEKSRQSLMSFHTTAAMFGLDDLSRAGVELEKFLLNNVSPNGADSLVALGFAVSSLADQMRNSGNGNPDSGIDLSEILELLGPAESELGAIEEHEMPVEAEVKASPPKEKNPGEAGENVLLNNVRELVKCWGGDLSMACDSTGCKFNLTFTGSSETVRKIEELLCSSCSPNGEVLIGSREEPRLEKLIDKGKEFMNAFSSGDVSHAQDILMDLADQQSQPSILYKEVGSLARGLHDSIRGFLTNLEPSLKEMVEDKIPDSGNRLEHMMEMTEKAAITTLDHVDAMQDRLANEMELISNLRSLLGGLNAIGDSAEKKLDQGNELLNAMESIIGQHRFDLDTIMTAQDYQDLSGQIILKITQLLKDIEGKLVNLIRTFGAKPEIGKQKTTDSLYGPAHAAVEDAVHSQDEVDSLLAEFGF